MAQFLYQLAYVATFVIGLGGGTIAWLLLLIPLSIPLHLLMRWEGHRRYHMPMEDWSPASFSLLLVGQTAIHLLLFGVGSGLGALARTFDLV
ncbi:MAG: hypothetical protein Kilf2KO_32430 [Rhodospirillales bacterium]